MCRVVNHLWSRDGLERHGREVELTLICSSCGTERVDLVDLGSGDVERHYHYAEDYLHKLAEGETRPFKSEYRREWFRTLLQEETGRVIRLPVAAQAAPPRKRKMRRSA